MRASSNTSRVSPEYELVARCRHEVLSQITPGTLNPEVRYCELCEERGKKKKLSGYNTSTLCYACQGDDEE